jgi:exodeoxyribonuclease VII large subunit
MLLGTSSIVDKDVLAALGPHMQAYTIEERRIPLTNPAAVSAALSAEKVDADLIAIVRGGGEGLSALSDRQVIEAVAYHEPVPIVSAVGHEVDQPLIQDLVYWAFPTPTALGTWLAARATGALHARDAVASDHRREREAMQRQLKDLSEEAGALRRRVRRMKGIVNLLPVGMISWDMGA